MGRLAGNRRSSPNDGTRDSARGGCKQNKEVAEVDRSALGVVDDLIILPFLGDDRPFEREREDNP